MTLYLKLKRILTLTLTLSLLYLPSLAAGEALLPSLKSDGTIKVPDNLQKNFNKIALAKFKPLENRDFTDKSLALFKEDKDSSPALLFGDFNGDQVKDACLLLTDSLQIVPVLILSNPNKEITVFKMESWDKEKNGQLESTYLSLLAQGEVKFSNRKVKSKRDLIQVETYLGAVNAYFFDGKKVQPYKGVVP